MDKRNMQYLVTIREYAQTRELCELWNIKYSLIDKHAGKYKINKIINLFLRSSKLKNFIRDKNISLAISHGSRTQLVTCNRSHIPSILMLDYEYTENKIFNYLSNYLLMPVFIPDERLIAAGFNMNKVIRYNGFKEEIYLSEFKADPDFRKKINVSENDVLVVIRPPSLLGNYRNYKSENLFVEAIKFFSEFSNCCCYIISRTIEDRNLIKFLNLKSGNFRFLEKTVDGLQILNAADIVLSGGGTMNRESALLGTDTYSIFKGKKPYLDEYLRDLGLMKFIDSIDDFKKIIVEKKKKKKVFKYNSNLVNELVNIFSNINN
jgi:predicted glycosyltransferase